MGMDSVIGVSRVVEKLERCHECYLEAMSAAANYGKEEGNIHFISDDERTESFDKVMVHQSLETATLLFMRQKNWHLWPVLLPSTQMGKNRSFPGNLLLR